LFFCRYYLIIIIAVVVRLLLCSHRVDRIKQRARTSVCLFVCRIQVQNWKS